MARSSDGVSSLARAVSVLETFDAGTRDLSASQVAARAGIPTSTAHRMLNSLSDLGLVERMPTKRYRIGLRLWELAVRTPGALGIRELAMPVLLAAHAAIGQNLQLGILQGVEVLYLERLSAPGATVNLVVVGGRLPFHSTSTGLVLAAFADAAVTEPLLAEPRTTYRFAPRSATADLRRELGTIRMQGYAITRGYIDPRATSIAVPIMDPLGAAVAAISAIVPSDEPREEEVLSVLRPAARRISRALLRAYRGTSEG